jgi:hypothetical protein
VTSHIKQVTGNGKLVTFRFTGKPFLKMLQMVAAINSLGQLGMVAPQDKTRSAKPGTAGNESSQLRNPCPADKIEVDFVKQRTSPGRRPSRETGLCSLNSVLLALRCFKVRVHRA